MPGIEKYQDMNALAKAVEAMVMNSNGELELEIKITEFDFSVEWLGIDSGYRKATLVVRPSDVTRRHPSRRTK